MACALYPLVDGKKSLLYEELIELTNDRKLTNLLYALSLQPEIKKLFASSDLNSQGEPKASILIDKLNVKEVIDDKASINVEAKKLGAISKKGTVVYFDNPTEKMQDVIDFNSTHENIKAVIRYSEKGYYIEVESINADNYNTNNVYKRRIAIYQALIKRLEDSGLNTAFSPDTEEHYNAFSVNHLMSSLKDFKKADTPITMEKAELIMDLFAGDANLERIFQQFGEDTAQAISQVSGWHYSKGSVVDIDDYQEEQIKNFLDDVRLKMKKAMKATDIDNLIAEAEASFAQETTLMGTETIGIRQTLTELYKDYMLDQDSFDLLQKRITTLSDAAKKLFLIRLKRKDEAVLKGVNDAKEKKALEKLSKELDTSSYISSIMKMMQAFQNSLGDIQVLIKKQQKKLDEDPDNLKAIRSYSNLLMRELNLVKDYQEIMKEMQTADLLENDDDLESEFDVEDIKELAAEINKELIDREVVCRKKQYDVVHAFLKIYWGEDTEDARKARGSDTTLDQIMKTASKDINMFDRLLYSVGTCNDEMMALIAKAVKTAKEKRDKALRGELAEMRSITEELYKSGSDTKFMYNFDENGNPTYKLISDHNYDKYVEDMNAYRESLKEDENIDAYEIYELMDKWRSEHTKTVKEFGISLTVPYYMENGKNIYENDVKVKDKLTPTQYKYYEAMMTKKAQMLDKMPAASNDKLYDVIEMSNDVVTAVAEAGGDPTKLFEVMKNKFADAFKTREDDTEYSYTQEEILEGNGMVPAHINARGEVVQTLPMHYTNKIKDRSRVSVDFSKSMMAYMASATEYVEMDKIFDALMLSKDYMLNRKVAQTEGGNILTDISKAGKKTLGNIATKMGFETGLGGLAEDFFERNVFGKSKKNEGYLFGTKVRIDKVTDALTGYTSVAGLTVNALGAEANILVGKVQMLIDAGLGMGGEFFNMKDLAYADVEYFHMLGPLLNEINSTTKSSPLGLLMERFDVSDDFYEKIKETGFYKQPISKIIGNKSLFFLYGIGEHLLHAQGMIAVLHNKRNKVLDEKGNEHILLDAFEVIKDENGQGTLKVKEGWTRANGEAIDDEYLDSVKGKIAYVNKSMHGAFNSADKGMIHRYAVGRLVMNFRQWMPAHYSRRFRGRHWDADLGTYREGYYVSTYKFIRDCGKDLYHKRFQILTRWNELSEDQRYNLRRAAAETVMLATLTAILALLGPAKDAKGNWAKRHLIYELSRMRLEVGASTPVDGYGFIDNGLKLVKSPMACISTLEKMSNLLKLTDMCETIESGKYKGENKYVRNVEKSLPFYGQIIKMLEMGESNDLFLLFN